LTEPNNPPTGDPAQEQGGVVPYQQPVDTTIPPQEGPVAQQREDARKKIAYILLGILIAELIFFACTLFLPDYLWQRAQDFMQFALAATFSLVSGMVGFYFGSQR
jgi:hypothetical protein